MIRTTTILLAAAAMLATTAMTPATGADDGRPRGAALHPAKLARAEPPRLLHGEGRTIVDGATRVRVREPGRMAVLGRSGRAYVVQLTTPDEHWRLLRVNRAGEVHPLGRGPHHVDVSLSLGGRNVAIAHHARGTTRVHVVHARTGGLVADRRFRGWIALEDYGVHRMVLSEWSNQRTRTFWWNPVTNRRTRISGHPTYVADVAANRLGLVTKDAPDGRLCQKVVRFGDTANTLWRSCRYRALEFSPDGRRMVTTDILADGPGPAWLQLRNDHGRLRATYRAELFGSIAWESRRSVLLQTAGSEYASMVRCTLGDGCERASRLYRVTRLDPFGAMAWSFPR